VFFKRLSEMRDRSFESQRYRASGLNLLVAAIILWNTVYLERATRARSAMALEMRVACEKCSRTLQVDDEAYICSYECTFCARCSAQMKQLCPNCGGGFVPRPIRPAKQWRDGVCVASHPASDKRVHLKYSRADVADHAARIRDVPPGAR